MCATQRALRAGMLSSSDCASVFTPSTRRSCSTNSKRLQIYWSYPSKFAAGKVWVGPKGSDKKLRQRSLKADLTGLGSLHTHMGDPILYVEDAESETARCITSSTCRRRTASASQWVHATSRDLLAFDNLGIAIPPNGSVCADQGSTWCAATMACTTPSAHTGWHGKSDSPPGKSTLPYPTLPYPTLPYPCPTL
jgi:hypothetical protein